MREHYDVIVVGGGPAGASVARRVARAGFRVAMLEQHPQIGQPVQCSGLVSPRTMREAKLDPGIAFNVLTGATVSSPNGSCYEIGGTRIHAYVLDRQQFDQHLVSTALDEGVDLWLDTRVEGLESIDNGIDVSVGQNGASRTFRARIVVGADGPRSKVAGFLGLPPTGEVIRARGADVRLPRRPPADRVHIFTGERYAPGFFAWIIPLDGDRYRIGWGYGRPASRTDPMQALIQDHPRFFEGMQILSQTGGLIPLGPRQRLSAARGLVVGDAAGQAKATSGGGLYTSLLSARHCATAVIDALMADDTSAEQLSAYDTAWRAGIGRELAQASVLRAAYRGLTDRDIERALRTLRIPGMRQIVDRYGDIDFPSWLATKALRFAPGLMRLLDGHAMPGTFHTEPGSVAEIALDTPTGS